MRVGRRRAVARRRRDPVRASTTRCSCSASRRCPRASSARRSSSRGRSRPASPPTPAYFALRAQRTMRDARPDQGRPRRAGREEPGAGVRTTPNAMFRKAVTAEQVLGSRVVCEPLHLWMLCSPNEGAAAVVLRRAEGDAAACGSSAVALRSHLPGNVLDESTPLAGLVDDAGITPPTTLAARDAYEAAGRRPRRPRRGRVPGHRRGPRAAHVGRARAVRAGRAALDARRPTAVGASVGEPLRRAAVEGRAARRLGARPGGRAGAPAARRRPAPARSTGARVAPRPHHRPRRQRQRHHPHHLTATRFCVRIGCQGDGSGHAESVLLNLTSVSDIVVANDPTPRGGGARGRRGGAGLASRRQ